MMIPLELRCREYRGEILPLPLQQGLRNAADRHIRPSRALQTQRSKPRVVIRAPAERPVILALACGNGQIVDARDAPLHEPAIVELPVLVAVRAIPVARIVVPLIGETHGNAI